MIINIFFKRQVEMIIMSRKYYAFVTAGKKFVTFHCLSNFFVICLINFFDGLKQKTHSSTYIGGYFVDYLQYNCFTFSFKINLSLKIPSSVMSSFFTDSRARMFLKVVLIIRSLVKLKFLDFELTYAVSGAYWSKINYIW
ncbi:Protein of unknown function [Gryllus bimaculatus]|nr:Protein of unknown function [Gryllus bimaculatus]